MIFLLSTQIYIIKSKMSIKYSYKVQKRLANALYIVYIIVVQGTKEENNMTKYTAIFANGFELVKTDRDFKSRLDFYNYICENRLGKEYGKLKEITCSVLPR